MAFIDPTTLRPSLQNDKHPEVDSTLSPVTMNTDTNLFRKYFTIFLVVSGYWVVSISTVFINKLLLSHLELDAPLSITFSQTVVTALICYVKKLLSKAYPHKFSFPDIDVTNSNIIKAVLPLSIMFTAMIASNNLCLKYVSVSFYYIGRSLTTVFNVILMYLVLNEKTSKSCLLCCAVIVFGFWLGVDQENLAGSLSILGTIFGILGSLSLSAYSIWNKKVLPKVDGNIWALSYASNVYASLLFIPMIILSNELPEVAHYKNLFTIYFWFILLVGGICGFSIGYFTSLQIKYTSPLTHNISGTAKACAQTVLAAYWYREVKSMLWWNSNLIVLLGSAAYARLKQLDMERKHLQGANYQKV